MENAAKALGIAGGVLIALVIAASLLYTFNRMSQIPEQQNYAKELEQLTEFNEQFEAYQKKLMYGVDVISCLNKVLDNNKKSQDYMGGAYDIDISININSDLSDTVEIYYFNIKDKEIRMSERDLNNFDKTFGDIFGNVDNYKISKIKKNTKVNLKTYPSNMTKKTYNSTDKDDIKLLKDLSDSTVELKKVATNTNGDITEWSKVIWYTSAYNFKNKKFRCTSITYDNEGRVNSISFEELEKVT